MSARFSARTLRRRNTTRTCAWRTKNVCNRRSPRQRQLAAPPPAHVPVLTSSELAQLKPLVVVRTERDVLSAHVAVGAVYLASIWAVPLFWWARGFRGDYLLLSATHLLTALGFAVLLSRLDPLRDTLLFVRYTQGVSIGLVAFAASVGPEFPQGRVSSLSVMRRWSRRFSCR